MASRFGTWIYMIQAGVLHQLLVDEHALPWSLYITQQSRYPLGNLFANMYSRSNEIPAVLYYFCTLDIRCLPK